MKKRKISRFFLLPLAIVLMAMHSPRDPDCTTPEVDFFFGISSIEKVQGWSDFCFAEAGDEFFNPFGDHVNIDNLVDIPYSEFSGNPWNWWIEGGWGDGTFCFDDDTNPPGGFLCLEGTTTAANCPLNIYIQVVGECDNCINNSTGGTWYKGEMTIDPLQIGVGCGNGINMTRLQLQPRVNCTDMTKPWGCGPGEFQD